MICYRGRTFCTFDSCEKSSSCDRYFRRSDHRRAVKWWGGEDYPLCVFNEKPDCYELDSEAQR